MDVGTEATVGFRKIPLETPPPRVAHVALSIQVNVGRPKCVRQKEHNARTTTLLRFLGRYRTVTYRQINDRADLMGSLEIGLGGSCQVV